MVKKFIRKLIDVEIKLGFLHIPAAGIEIMPEKNKVQCGKKHSGELGVDFKLVSNARKFRGYGKIYI